MHCLGRKWEMGSRHTGTVLPYLPALTFVLHLQYVGLLEDLQGMIDYEGLASTQKADLM